MPSVISRWPCGEGDKGLDMCSFVFVNIRVHRCLIQAINGRVSYWHFGDDVSLLMLSRGQDSF
jgi:hypothetical protein